MKEANSLQALVDRGSGATDTGGFVSLLTVSNKAHALLFLGDDVREEGPPRISQFQIRNARYLFIDVIMNLEIYFTPPAFILSTLSFLAQKGNSVLEYSLTDVLKRMQTICMIDKTEGPLFEQ